MSRRRDIIGGEMYAETLEPVTPSGVDERIKALRIQAAISRLNAGFWATIATLNATRVGDYYSQGEIAPVLSVVAVAISVGGVAVFGQSAFARSQQASALEGALVSHQLANPGPSETPVLPPQ